MANLDNLLWDMQNGVGMFSPLTPFKSERKLARAIAPQLLASAGRIEEAGIRSSGGILESMLNRKAGFEQRQMAEEGAMARENKQQTGANFRQRLALIGDIIAQRMTTQRAYGVQGMSDRAAMKRLQEEGTIKRRLQRDLGDMEFTNLSSVLSNLSNNSDTPYSYNDEDLEGYLNIE